MIQYSLGASASVTSFARYDHKTMRAEAKYAIAFIAPARRRNVTIPPSAFPSQTVPIAQPKTTKMPVSNAKRAKVRRYAPMDSPPHRVVSSEESDVLYQLDA